MGWQSTKRRAELNSEHAGRAKRALPPESAKRAPLPWAREARPPPLGPRGPVSAARAGARVKQGSNEQGCLETPEEFNGFSGDCGQTLLYPRLKYETS